MTLDVGDPSTLSCRPHLSELISPRGHLDRCTLNVALYAVNDFSLFVHHSGQILNMRGLQNYPGCRVEILVLL